MLVPTCLVNPARQARRLQQWSRSISTCASVFHRCFRLAPSVEFVADQISGMSNRDAADVANRIGCLPPCRRSQYVICPTNSSTDVFAGGPSRTHSRASGDPEKTLKHRSDHPWIASRQRLLCSYCNGDIDCRKPLLRTAVHRCKIRSTVLPDHNHPGKSLLLAYLLPPTQISQGRKDLRHHVRGLSGMK